jgi:hypothetical protein
MRFVKKGRRLILRPRVTRGYDCSPAMIPAIDPYDRSNFQVSPPESSFYLKPDGEA